MNHRQDLILKRDLLDKEAECIDKQGTQIANQPNKPAITCVLQNCLRKLVCFFFFPPASDCILYSLCQINLDNKDETSATANPVTA